MLRLAVSIALALAVSAPAAPDVTTAFACSADLGMGLKSKRKFCDIILSDQLKDGVSMTIPAHRGATTLRFDLHNRYTIPREGSTPEALFARHTAVVAILDQTGKVLDRAAVSREVRTAVDIFDRIGGGVGPEGAIIIAPGRPEPVVLELPEAVSAISVVGVSLEAMSLAEQRTHTTPGRPVAIGSNFRIEYTPR
ncbi:MAG: hypothetical protein AB7L71_19420 [Vicinamibacterales bacterium]